MERDELIRRAEDWLRRLRPSDTGANGPFYTRLLLDELKAVRPEGQPWIPVSERLPKEGQRVLLAGVGEHLAYQSYARPDWIGPGKSYRATHWLLLPDDPLAPQER